MSTTNSSYNEDLPYRLIQLKDKFGGSFERFAKQIGLSGVAISKIAQGKGQMQNQTILAICYKFSIREEWIRWGNGVMMSDPLEATLTNPKEFSAELLRISNQRLDDKEDLIINLKDVIDSLREDKRRLVSENERQLKQIRELSTRNN